MKKNLFLTNELYGGGNPLRFGKLAKSDYCARQFLVFGVDRDDLGCGELASIVNNPKKLACQIRKYIKTKSSKTTKATCLFAVHWGGKRIQKSEKLTQIIRANLRKNDNFTLTYWSGEAMDDTKSDLTYIDNFRKGVFDDVKKFWDNLIERSKGKAAKTTPKSILRHKIQKFFEPIFMDLGQIETDYYDDGKPKKAKAYFNKKFINTRGVGFFKAKLAEALSEIKSSAVKDLDKAKSLLQPKNTTIILGEGGLFDFANFAQRINNPVAQIKDFDGFMQSYISVIGNRRRNLFHEWLTMLMDFFDEM